MTDANFHIETPRLYLSYFQPAIDAHCDHLVALYTSPEFTAMNGGRPSSISTREAARHVLSTQWLEEHARNGYGKYLVSRKPADWESLPAHMPIAEKLARSTPVGMVTLMRGASATAYKVPDIGFVTLPGEMRKGYAKEAALALLKYVKEEKGVDVVFGATDTDNEASRAVLRSLGFEHRGTRSLSEFGGDLCDVWVTPGAEDLSVYGM